MTQSNQDPPKFPDNPPEGSQAGLTDSTPLILIAEDGPYNLEILGEILAPYYHICVATSGKPALERAQTAPQPDLILLDVMMPDMDGLTVCRHLKASARTRHIPVIFCTSLDEPQDEEQGFAAGGIDYIIKPVKPSIVLARIQTHLQLLRQRQTLEKMVLERTRDLILTRDITIFSLAALAETRDSESGGHIKRTQQYIKILAQAAKQVSPYRHQLDESYIELLFKSAPLHDIGKVGIPDAILLKPGKLTAEEFNIMKTHTTIGRDALLKGEAAHEGKDSSSFLSLAREVAYSHHERWNGTGYPLGLNGEEIPLSGRLMAVVDVYDAMTCKRVYKPPLPHREAVDYIVSQGGHHFDPGLATIFKSVERRFLEVKRQLTTGEEERVLLEKAWSDGPIYPTEETGG